MNLKYKIYMALILNMEKLIMILDVIIILGIKIIFLFYNSLNFHLYFMF